ncbi:MAG: type II toxin-antitoxin system prevent-host-death family antitoxin [Verrucomicrobiae bacterium]
MRTATVADLRNNFSTVSNWINHGESVTITKRGLPFATLAPTRRRKAAPEWPDREEWRRKLFPDGQTHVDVQNVLDYDRGDT